MSLLINSSEKWAFIHIPKTGGTSLSSIIRKIGGTNQITGHDSIRWVDDVSDYYIFTIVRNPYTRIASAYNHELRKKTHNYTFGEFLKNSNPFHQWILPQSYYINAGKTKNRKISYVAYYENYGNDVKHILNTINCNSNIPHLNRNPIYDTHPTLNQEKYYNNFFTEEWMVDWVKERYQDDFKIFNYDMDLPR